jgi:hypothetical protein
MSSSQASRFVDTTSAGRLHLILSEAVGQNPDSVAYEVWARIFGLDKDDRAAVLHGVAELIQLVLLTKQQILALPDIRHELYTPPLNRIAQVLGEIPLTQRWQQFVANFDPLVLNGVAFCADALARYHVEQPIEQEALKDLKNKVEALTAEVLESSLPPALRQLILEKLEVIRSAIIWYRVRGADGLRVALESSVGALVLNRASAPDKSKVEELTTFVSLLNSLGELASKALGYYQLAKPVIMALLSRGQSADQSP